MEVDSPISDRPFCVFAVVLSLLSSLQTARSAGRKAKEVHVESLSLALEPVMGHDGCIILNTTGGQMTISGK